MYTSGAYNYANQLPTNYFGGGNNFAANFGGGFMQAANQQRGNLWNLPVQNFRIDGGANNIFNQVPNIDWPQFRPQAPILSGPRVRQDTTDIYAMPAPSFSFEDHGYRNFFGGFIGGGFPGVNLGFGGGFPSVGLPKFPNLPGFPSFPFPGGNFDGGMKGGGKTGPLSGRGTIDGTSFRSGDGERYELSIDAGKSYNLLSDVGIGLNGTYGEIDGETVLTDIALNVGGKIVTLSDDGTLRIDGKVFDKRSNLRGFVTEERDGTYTVKANGYEFELKASEDGIKVNINAKFARMPEGLWGVALDGEKNTEQELQRAIRENDYRVDDVLTFDYEENNNIGDKFIPDLDEEERNALAWNASNPNLERGVSLLLNSNADGTWRNAGIRGRNGGRAEDSYWMFDALKSNKFYNVLSDEDIQVNGKFDLDGSFGNKPTELGFVVNGDSVRVSRDDTQNLVIRVNGDVIKAGYNDNGISFQNGKLTINSDSDEGWKFEVAADRAKFLSLQITADHPGENNTRSSGLLGDSIVRNVRDLDAGDVRDRNGAGYLRSTDGALSKAGEDMAKALREYEVDSWDDTSSGRSVYE